MAEKSLRLDVVTPEKTVVSEDVDIVMAPGYFGEFGALPNHIPFLAQLQAGEVKYRKGGQLESMAVGGGYAEVLPTQVTVLAVTAERSKDIDVESNSEHIFHNRLFLYSRISKLLKRYKRLVNDHYQ